MFGLSAEADPLAALAALRGIDVRIVGSRERGGQFALPLPAPGGTAFHRESFGVLRPGAARGSPEGIHVGRMTSCAHRLGKPDRTSLPLTSSVARRPRARGLLCRATVGALHTPCVMQEGSAAPGPPDPAAGLGRRNPTNQDAFHRIDPNLAARVGESRSLFTFAPRPAPCRLPRSWAGPVKGRLVASGYPHPAPRAFTRRAWTRKDASLRLLQPTYDHVHPARTIRFPGVPPPGAAPCGATSELGHRPAFGRWTSGRSTGRASLDGDPPASAIAHDSFPACVRGLDPERSRRRGPHAVLAELRSAAPPRSASRPQHSLPRAELVTWPLTPLVRPGVTAAAPS